MSENKLTEEIEQVTEQIDIYTKSLKDLIVEVRKSTQVTFEVYMWGFLTGGVIGTVVTAIIMAWGLGYFK